MHHNVFGCGSKLLGNNHVMKLIPKNLEIANSTWNYVLPHRNSPQARKISINDEILFTPEIKKQNLICIIMFLDVVLSY